MSGSDLASIQFLLQGLQCAMFAAFGVDPERGTECISDALGHQYKSIGPESLDLTGVLVDVLCIV